MKTLTFDQNRSAELQAIIEKAGALWSGKYSGGVPDQDGAIEYYNQAVSAGSVDAMIGLGNIYEEKEDYESAYYWYHEAAAAGSIAGIFNVARMYHIGLYVKQDYQKAMSYFSQLYEQHIPRSVFFMGLYAEKGYSGSVDYPSAIRFYEEGIAYGDPQCANNLGSMYCRGAGIVQDTAKGFQLFLEGYEMAEVDEDSADLCANLGRCYQEGHGTEIDLERALALYREGADLGSVDCEKRYQKLLAKIEAEEVHE